MNTKAVSCPPEVVERVTKINKELVPFGWKEGQPRPQLVAFHLEDGRNDNDWRCNLVDADGMLLAEYLAPEELHWHAVRMMLNGFHNLRKSVFKAGMQEAADRLHEHNKRVLGLIK